MGNGNRVQPWDVIVIGGGAAGLMACLELPSQLRVLLLSKDSGPPSASRWAQGGIAAVTASEDSFTSHQQDTIRAGAGLCDHAAVELLVHQAPACVKRLLDLGMAFDREDGRLCTTLEAAHSHRRVLHAQDRTGGALVDALEREVQHRPGLEQRRGAMALRLWLKEGRCCGVQILENNHVLWLAAGAVVLATGGGGHLFAHTTNPDLSSGDGVAMAWQAGAQVRDLEFVQFHPTALMLPGAPHFLISEAVRGEGAQLVDHDGQSPVAGLTGADLAPRDQVSRALARRMRDQAMDHLWLDLRPVGRERLERQFPTILGRCRELGLEPLQERIPVAPAAHYWMGGISTDLQAATNLPGLYAVGEVACTGVHGANRLASNSLMECLVFARQLGELRPVQVVAPLQPPESRWLRDALPSASELREEIVVLRQQCWSVAGVERCGHALAAALPDVARRRHQLEHQPAWQTVQQLGAGEKLNLAPGQESNLRLLHELHHRLVLAELLIRASLFREESRGGHFRTDAPARQPFWRRHSLQSLAGEMTTTAVDEADNLRISP
jgi:L-aspartate oxidase